VPSGVGGTLRLSIDGSPCYGDLPALTGDRGQLKLLTGGQINPHSSGLGSTVPLSCIVERGGCGLKSGREQVEIVALYEELGSYRAVAAVVGCDHKTVKRYVELAGELGQLAPTATRARVTDEFRELIREHVEQSRGRITARRLLRVLSAAGYERAQAGAHRAY
jgi:hypothetical protein